MRPAVAILPRPAPIEVGHAWTYDVKVLGWCPVCSSGRHTATDGHVWSDD